MTASSKNSIWNRRKGEIENDEDISEDSPINRDSFENEELIARVQKRVGVSRDEAKRIIRNSELT